MGIYKDVEFAEFIKEIENGSIGHWQEIAEALDVDPDTITKWKKTPEAVEARRKGIAKALAGMEKAGIKDWRMWAEKLKMLGVSTTDKLEVKVTDARKDVLLKYGLSEGGDGDTPNNPS